MYGASRPFARAIRARGESYASGSAGSGGGAGARLVRHRAHDAAERRTALAGARHRPPRFAVIRSPVVTAPFGGRADERRVLGQDPGPVAGRAAATSARTAARPRRPGRRGRAPPIDVDDDRVAFLDDGDRAAERGLRRDVADHQAVGPAREPAVGQERDRIAQALADERAGDLQHLLHARPADRALVADDDDVAGLDLLGADRVVAGRLRIEDAGRSAVLAALVAGELDHAAVGRQRAVEDGQPAGRLERRLERDDDLLAGRLDGVRRDLGDRPAVDGRRRRRGAGRAA